MRNLQVRDFMHNFASALLYPSYMNMSKNLHFIGVFILIATVLGSCVRQPSVSKIEPELSRLDEALDNVKSYDRHKAERLDSLYQLIVSTPQDSLYRRWDLTMQTGLQYFAFCSDSSAIFFKRACALASNMEQDSLLVKSRLNLAFAQSAAGLFYQAWNTLDALDTAALTPKQRLGYALVCRQLYSYMEDYSRGSDNSTYEHKNHEYEQYLIDNLPPDDNYRRFLRAQQLQRNGDNEQAEKIAEQLLKKLKPGSNLYGMTAYLMATIVRSEGNDNDYGRYLAIAALSDIKGNVKETLALQALAKWLYNKGEVDRAYKYINQSLHDAQSSNARMRTVELAPLMPLADDAYRKQISSTRDELMIYLALAVILFVVAGGLLVAVFLNMRRVSSLNRKLEQQTKVQESYIGHFLGLVSSYSDKLDSMQRLVKRKIAAGQTDELIKMLKSGKYADTENDDFFVVFDETFLDLYPDFPQEFNNLLKPECRLTFKKGEPLTTEIRIYAFVRLGVVESVKIAQILHCSVSTIYTYRNRMRGRAINRDTFEKDVLRIGHI